MATSEIAVVRFCFLVTPRKWDYVNLHRRDRKTYIDGKLLHQDWAIQPGILFCTHHNPFESRSMPLAPPDLSKERGSRSLTCHLTYYPPMTRHLMYEILNTCQHLIPRFVNEICLELRLPLQPFLMVTT